MGAGAKRVRAPAGSTPSSADVAASVRGAGARPRAIPVAGLERSGGRHQSPVERQEIGLRQRTFVRDGDPQQDLAFALGIADGPSAGGVLGTARFARQLGALIEQRDDLAIEGVDAVAQPAKLGRLEGPWRSGRAVRH